ncbi:Tn3 family transposase, partial [Streptomyces sp. NPDC090442]|uniref:Tn3 family transposase n=1 Tax=Streptomyces sp. NPDC090442 TaxID=3365962 RepID=UPI0038141D8C
DSPNHRDAPFVTPPSTPHHRSPASRTREKRSRGLNRGKAKFREHVNTLLMQQVLADPKWADQLTEADRGALSPLFWTHVNPYGRFELDMNSRLDLDLTATAAAVPGPRDPQDERAAAPA